VDDAGQSAPVRPIRQFRAPRRALRVRAEPDAIHLTAL
jgi:hypothetical protein